MSEHERMGMGAEDYCTCGRTWPHLREGDRVRWNALGKHLFGDTGSEGLLLRIDGDSGNVHWESGQDTSAALGTLELVPEPCGRSWRAHVCVLPKGDHYIHMDADGYRWL